MTGPALERIATHTAEVGRGLYVHRALPTRARRMVGAWCFLDHAGPHEHGPGEGLRVGPHPHIGLQTFTWMIEGEVLHRDSLGYEQLIRPGQVNLMTAGRGIAHAEESVGDAAGRVHAAQLWIALPDSERHREPAFAHHPELPRIDDGGLVITVLVGSSCGQTAPPQVFTPLVGLDLTATGAARTNLPLREDFEHAALCLEGEAIVAGERIAPDELLYLGTSRDGIEVATDGRARLLLIGGEPFGEDVLLWWNFVGRTREDMVTATADWNAGQRFGEVRGSPLSRLHAPDVSALRLREPGK
jgi:redox-sensitive bicupin YhaK (pirin superfamily)